MTIPSGFQLYGNRYFRIVHETEDWETAERRCREMGGYLASFRNEEEINAIKEHIQYIHWIGINDQEKEGHFVSVPSHKPAPFLKWDWYEGEPDDRTHKQNCAFLYKDKMGDYYCNEKLYFICQAENEI
ncbi:hypothetical protein KR059_007696 [Drosophila kikkawai]|nr:hypothetical protein KR059_007696 [Drosophila kikkawai]